MYQGQWLRARITAKLQCLLCPGRLAAQCRDLVHPPVLGDMSGALTQRGNDFTMGKGDGSERGQYNHECSCCECWCVVFPCAKGS